MSDELRVLAAACGRALPVSAESTAESSAAFSAAFDALVAAVAREPQFTFDADGRPAAVAVVRDALPPSEAELLDAILEDVTAELNAHRAAFLLVLAALNPEP